MLILISLVDDSSLTALRVTIYTTLALQYQSPPDEKSFKVSVQNFACSVMSNCRRLYSLSNVIVTNMKSTTFILEIIMIHVTMCCRWWEQLVACVSLMRFNQDSDDLVIIIGDSNNEEHLLTLSQWPRYYRLLLFHYGPHNLHCKYH